MLIPKDTLKQFKDKAQSILAPSKSHYNEFHARLLERQVLMQARFLLDLNCAKPFLSDLSELEFSVFSQWGEDGIINWLVSRIPGIPEKFIEFGVENYRESNTRLLLLLRNWVGIVIDGSEHNIQDIRQQDIFWRHSLIAKTCFLDKDNINAILQDSGFSGRVGVLSIDIDGNDFWVWQAIQSVEPVIVVIEYNAVFGDINDLTIPYSPDFIRNNSHYSNLYFGASLSALIKLGAMKGYTFLGTTSSGCNAFFVLDEFSSCITSALLASWAYPSKYRESRDTHGHLTFIDGCNRGKQIEHLPLLNPFTNASASLSDYSCVYSCEWASGSKTLHKSFR